MRRLALGTALVLLLAGCASPTDGGVSLSGEPDRLGGGGADIEYPPDVVVRGGGEVLRLTPFTFCWSNACADGVPPETVPDVGAHSELTVEFPVEGWQFSAGFQRAGDPCARTQTIELERLSPTTFALPPAGFAGTYLIDLFGRGPGGDVATQLLWTATTDGELRRPRRLWPCSPTTTAPSTATGYDVELVLDGVTHRARATWPDDVIPDFEPSVSLTFDPPLPAVTAPGR